MSYLDDALVPVFVAPIRSSEIVGALERLEEATNNEAIRRYVESLRLAIERTELLDRERAAAQEAGADRSDRTSR